MKLRKFLSVLLLAAMCLSMMTVAAFAEEGKGVIVIPVEEDNEENEVIIVEPPEDTEAESDDPVIIQGQSSFEITDTDETVDKAAPEGTVCEITRGKEILYYPTLGEALADCKDGDILRVLKAVNMPDPTLHIDNNITIIFDEPISFTANAKTGEAPAIRVMKDKSAKIQGDIIIKSSTVDKATYSYTLGIDAQGKLSLVNSTVTMEGEGTMFSGAVKLSGADSSFTKDPAGFVDEAYEAYQNAEGLWLLKKKAADPETSAVTGPAEYALGGEAIKFQSKVKIEKVGFGAKDSTEKDFLKKDQDFTLNAEGTEITLLPEFLDTKSAGSYSLHFFTEEMSDCIKTELTITAIEPKLTGPAEYIKGSKAPVYEINAKAKTIAMGSKDSIKNKVLEKDTHYTLDDTGLKFTLLPAYLDTLKAGEYQLIVSLIGADKTAKLIVTVKDAPAQPGKVTDDEGKEISYVEHYKGKSGQSLNKEMIFQTEPELKALKANGKLLTEDTDYSVKSNYVSIAKDAAFLEALPAGYNTLSFEFEDKDSVDVKLAVWPSVTVTPGRYPIGSGSGIVLSFSDAPNDIAGGYAADEKQLNSLKAEDYSLSDSGNKVTVKSSYLDKLKTGSYYIGAEYDCGIMLMQIKIVPAPTVKPIDSNKDCKWYYGDSKLGFAVSPDVKGVSIDGKEISEKSYSVSEKNVLYLNASLLKELAYGEHTLVVKTTDGDASIKFNTYCSLVPKDTDKHTKGGKKDLVFISSDPIEAVFVGKKELKDDFYSLSKDKKTLTLKAVFLNQLNVNGDYTVTVKTDAGAASCGFKILSAGAAGSSPKTGDSSGMLLWTALLILSGAGALALLPKKKHNK